jgi:cholesterol transport system auxiliary component
LTPHRLTILLTAPALAVALSACISLLPKTKPDQLYSFGHAAEAKPAVAPGPASAGVLLAAVAFPRAATGDGILTMTGDKTAYIAESRWSGPASVLFREAVERAFDTGAQQSRLISRGETGKIGLVLRLDVRDFEAIYQGGPGSAPTIAVVVKARLTRPDGTAADEKTFDVRKPAGDDRVGAIVQAFDAATAEALTGLVAWTDQTAAALPPPAPPPPPVK